MTASPAAYLTRLRELTAPAGKSYIPLTYDGGVELEHALEHSRLLIVGAPGSGKTTFLQHLAFLWCCALEEARTYSLPFPILIRIADLADLTPAGLIDFLNQRNVEHAWGLPPEFFRRQLTAGGSVLLLDGLEQAPAAVRLVEQAAEDWRHCRFVVATRPFPRAGLSGFETVQIELLQSTLTCRSLS